MSNRIDKHNYYLNIAKAVSLRSTCLRRNYGCVIVKNDEIIATGYNGSPRGELNCCDIHTECPRKHKTHNSGDYSDCPAVHAEQNALISASRQELLGSTVYLYGKDADTHESFSAEPCPICHRLLKNAGVKCIITKTPDNTLVKTRMTV